MHGNRLTLITFGGISIQSAEGIALSAKASRRQPLVLLAILAVAGSVGATRDRICALLWPESDTDRARNALKQTIFSLRRDLGEPDLVIGTSEIRLNPEVIGSDVAEFTSAVKERDFERAALLYTGQFLQGVYLRNAPEFERWAEAERSKLADQADSAMRSAARAASTRGNHELAARLWRQVVALQPLDTVATLELMRSLVLRGDRGAALRQAKAHTTTVSEELGADPDARVGELAREIASQTSGPDAEFARESGAARTKRGAATDTAQFVTTPAGGGPPDLVRGFSASDGRRRLRSMAVGIATAVIIGAVWYLANGLRADSPQVANAPVSVFIAPFRVDPNDASLSFLREGMVDLLSSTLSGDSTSARTIDASAVFASLSDSTGLRAAEIPLEKILEAARKTGSSLVVSGSVSNTSRNVLVTASMYDASNGKRLGDAQAAGNLDSLPRLVDQLASQLLAIQMGAGEVAPELLSGTPLAAVRSYLDGRAAFRRGAYEEAVHFQKRALLLDSTFALAALELGRTAGWIGDDGARFMAYRIAWANMNKLRPLDRALIGAMLGPGYPKGATTAQLLGAWEHITEIMPEEPEGWYEVGDVFFHNPWLGTASDQEGLARAGTLFSRALARAPDYLPALQHRLQLAAHDGDTATVRRLEVAALRIRPGSDLDTYLQWRTAVALNDPTAIRVAWSHFQPANSLALQWVAMTSEEDGIPLGDAARALQERLRVASTDQERADALQSIHALDLNRGEARAASQAASVLRRTQPESGTGRDLQILDAVYGGVPVDSSALSAVEEIKSAAAGPTAGDRDRWSVDRCILGHWFFARDDRVGTERAAAMLDKLRAAHPEERWAEQALTCAQLLRAFVAVREHGRGASGLAKDLDKRMSNGPYMTSRLVWDSSVIGSARLFELDGDYAAAENAIRRRSWLYRWPNYLARQLYDLARFAALHGDRSVARDAYVHYLRLRVNPDPALAPEVASARTALNELTKAR